MTTIVKVHKKGQMTLPTGLRTLAGIVEGDFVEATFLQGKIVITRRVIVESSSFQNTNNEYTPAQRKIVDAQLAEGLSDVKAGRVHGPFTSAKDATAYIERRRHSGDYENQ